MALSNIDNMSRNLGALEGWLSSYLAIDGGEKICWRDGEKLSLALYNLDQDWFSNLRYRILVQCCLFC